MADRNSSRRVNSAADPSNTSRQRRLLSTARYQHAAQVQGIKFEALDRIIINMLYASSENEWIDSTRLQQIFRTDSGGYVLTLNDIDSSLRRLRENHTVEPHKTQTYRLFRLSQEARISVALVEDQADKSISTIVGQLFASAPGGSKPYADAFIFVISEVFNDLGEESINYIRGRSNDATSTTNVSAARAVESAILEFPNLDEAALVQGVQTFFEESDPRFDELKWNLAQNLFIAKALGLDSSGGLLSLELFEDAVFYLDTNFLIPGLEPVHREHGLFKTFVESAQKLGAHIFVCPTTIREIQAWAGTKRAEFERVGTGIPSNLSSKVDSIFLDKYEQLRKAGKEPSIDDVFIHFSDVRGRLGNEYQIKLADDPWFERAFKEERVERFAARLKELYQPHSGRAKRLGAARHDAIALLWIDQLRRNGQTKTWFVTTDRSLPKAVPEETETASLAITVTALMQWIAPILGLSSANNPELQSGFAHMIRERVLPRERFLDLQDFMVFHHLNISIDSLPPEQVLKSVAEIKAHIPHLDPSDPADQLMISGILARHLADPATEQNQTIAKLEASWAEDREKWISQQEVNLRELEAAKGQIDDLAKQLIEIESDKESSVTGLKTEFQKFKHDKDREDKTRKLKAEGIARLGIVILITLFTVAACIYASNEYADGKNLMQKVKEFWVFFAVIPIAACISSWFIVGRERFIAIGGPLPKVFRAE